MVESNDFAVERKYRYQTPKNRVFSPVIPRVFKDKNVQNEYVVVLMFIGL